MCRVWAVWKDELGVIPPCWLSPVGAASAPRLPADDETARVARRMEELEGIFIVD